MVAKSKTQSKKKRVRMPRASQKELDEMKERVNEMEVTVCAIKKRIYIEQQKVKKLAQILLYNLPERKLRKEVRSFCAEDGENCGSYKYSGSYTGWTLKLLLQKLLC